MTVSSSSGHDIRREFRALELYAREYDFCVWRGKPSVEYMLAAIPRSGSTHLAIELWRTGMMGAPLEYPNPPFRDAIRKRLGVRNAIVPYWRALKRVRTSSNGVFGFKMFIGNYMHYSREDPKLLREIAPPKAVFLTRSNLVAQAVSYSKAMRSGAWFHGVRERGKPVYDADRIRECILRIQYQIDFWNEVFALTGATVHHVTYEALVDDRDAVMQDVAEFLGVKLDPKAVIDLPRMRVQRNAESAAWVERFQQEQPAVASEVPA